MRKVQIILIFILQPTQGTANIVSIMGRPPIELEQKKQIVSMTLSPASIKIIDRSRGKTSRSAWLDKLILKQRRKA